MTFTHRPFSFALALCLVASTAAAEIRFVPGPTFPVGEGPRYLAFGEVNEDNVADVLVSSADAHVVTVLTSSSVGILSRLGPAIDIGRNLGQIVAQDFTEDGKVDIAVINESGGAQPGNVFIIPRTAPGTFDTPIELDIPDRRLESLVGADFDRANGPDFAVANGRSGTIRIYLNREEDSGFTALAPIEIRDDPRLLATGQMTRDNLPDLAVLNTAPTGGDEVVIVQTSLVGGGVQFSVTSQRPISGPPVVAMIVSDVNRDTLGDVLLLQEQVDRRYGLTVLINNTGTGANAPINFTKLGPITYECPRQLGAEPSRCDPVDLASADFDRDGRPDLAVSLNTPGGIDFLNGIGDGNFIKSDLFVTAGERPTDIILADVTGDRQVDLVVGDIGADTVFVLRNGLPPGLDNGEACTQSSQCSSSSCVDNVCCSVSDCPGSQRCDIPGSQGNCASLRQNGSTCFIGATCSSTFCTDGVCCNSNDCPGVERCDVLGREGFCNAPLPTATPTIPPTTTPTPQPNGRGCGQGSQCQSTFCVDEVCCSVASCDANRFCNISDVRGACNLRRLAGERCNLGSDCVSGTCLGGLCSAPSTPTRTPTPVFTRKPNGALCGNDGAQACTSLACTNGVCCSESRCAVGERCDVIGSKGDCVPQLGPGETCEKNSDCADNRACEASDSGRTCSFTPGPTPVPIACVGDCSSDGEVTVDELLIMIDIALGQQSIETCSAGDLSGEGEISVDEILTAVRFALSGCPVEPTATATVVAGSPTDTVEISTPTPTVSAATETATQTSSVPTATATVTPTQGSATVTPVVTDFSSFTEFAFDRFGAAGFCAPLGEVFSAVIRKQGTSYQLDLSILRQGQEPADECLPDFTGPAECATIDPVITAATLTPNETAQLLELFSAIALLNAPDPGCDVAEPCVVNVARFDTTETNDFPCQETNRLAPAEVERIVDFLNQLYTVRAG